MFKKMKHMKNEKGLTLIELLAVIVILAIIAAIAIPAIGNIINNSRDKAVLSDVSSAISAAKIANADGSCGASGTITALVTSGSTTGVTCTGDEFEFKSDKIKNRTDNKGEDITVIIDSDGIIKVTAVMEKKFSGTKISTAITDAPGASSPHTADGGSLVIFESDLNSVLGGN